MNRNENNNNNNNRRHHIIRIGDGINFEKSKVNVWGMVRGKRDCIKGFILNQVKIGDILWFCTNKNNGGKAIGMAEYICMYDRMDEKLININTYTNDDMGWDGDGEWDIQIHYKNVYNTKDQNINVILRGPSPIITYDQRKPNHKNIENLYKHYDGYKFYGKIDK